MSFCCKCKAGICKTQDCDSFCDCHPQEYPNDKETQEWMNAPLGVPDVERCKDCGWPLAKSVEEGCVVGNCSMRPVPKKHAESSIKFWSDKYDAKVDELHEMWQKANSFEGSFNSATETIKKLEEEIEFLKESRSKWAKQSSENADLAERNSAEGVERFCKKHGLIRCECPEEMGLSLSEFKGSEVLEELLTEIVELVFNSAEQARKEGVPSCNFYDMEALIAKTNIPCSKFRYIQAWKSYETIKQLRGGKNEM